MDDAALQKWVEAAEAMSAAFNMTLEEAKATMGTFTHFGDSLLSSTIQSNEKAKDFENEMLEVYENLPGGNIENLECPNAEGYECYNRDLLDMIIHLNDYHHWSREKIADWVEYFEDTEGISLAFEEKKDE
jgi:hypothetical protein